MWKTLSVIVILLSAIALVSSSTLPNGRHAIKLRLIQAVYLVFPHDL